MKLNCKTGDIAYHRGGALGSKSQNLGKIVTVGRFLGHVPGWAGNDRWEVDQPIHGACGSVYFHAEDKYLRPIRDNDGEDEMLRIAGKPQPNEVPA